MLKRYSYNKIYVTMFSLSVIPLVFNLIKLNIPQINLLKVFITTLSILIPSGFIYNKFISKTHKPRSVIEILLFIPEGIIFISLVSYFLSWLHLVKFYIYILIVFLIIILLKDPLSTHKNFNIIENKFKKEKKFLCVFIFTMIFIFLVKSYDPLIINKSLHGFDAWIHLFQVEFIKLYSSDIYTLSGSTLKLKTIYMLGY